MKRLDAGISTFVFIISLAIYVRTLAPSMLYGDSAEFQTIAYTLGMGHPTGYPIYILLAKLFTFIPICEIAYRVNLFSAFCAAFAVAIVYLIIRKLGGTYVSAIFGSLTLALTPLFWKHATIAEIYTLSAAWLALILYFVLQWKETNNPRWIFIAGFCGGLSLGIHSNVTLSGLAILLYLVLSTRQRVDWIQALFGGAVGLVIFISAFLFLDFLDSPAGYYNAVVRPSLSVWGMTTSDFDSPVERLAFLYFPPQFTGQFFAVSADEINTRLTDFSTENSSYIWLALIGFISLIIPPKNSSPRWREALLLVVAFTTFITFAITYDVFDFYVYYIPTTLILSICVGLGVNAIIEVVSSIPHLPRLVPAVLGILILVVGFYSSVNDITSSWRYRVPPRLQDWESYFFNFPATRRFEIEQSLNGIEDNAIIFTDWNRVYSYYYVAFLLQGKTAMDFHETHPQGGMSGVVDSTLAYIEANIDSRPIYFTEPPSELANIYRIQRAGSGLFRIERK
jgi:Protein of unknown function (DUF2723)